jgi:HMG (high mobility group) box
MAPDVKEIWDKKARKDKARYEVEKAMYKGPWKVPANKRTPKDPSAPKRPMSAFLAFSNKRRAGLKREHPDATNSDLSKMLSKTWREAPDDLRKKYMEEEAGLRAHYKVEMAKWRKKAAEDKKQERQDREAIAMQTAEARQNEPPVSNLASNAAGLGNQYTGGVGAGPAASAAGLGAAGLPGHLQQSHDMGAGGVGGLSGAAAAQMYGNPYSMSGAGAGGAQLGALGSFGMQGGAAADAAQYANLMAGGNPFAAQPFMGAANAAQQQLLTQLFGTSLCYVTVYVCLDRCISFSPCSCFLVCHLQANSSSIR